MDTGNERQLEDENSSMEQWDPKRHLTSISSEEVRWSNGFLRSRPEKWCSGFSDHWTSLHASFGVDVRVGESKPFLGEPKSDTSFFRATVDDQPVWLAFEQATVETLLNELHPRMFSKKGGAIFIEYIAQRFLIFLAQHQAIIGGAGIKFFGRAIASDCNSSVGVKVSFTLNGTACGLSLFLPESFVQRMDGLWRRQVHSSIKNGPTVESTEELRVEIAQLSVPPHILPQYLKKGAVIDLEKGVSDQVLLRLGSKAFMCGTLMRTSESLVCKTAPGLPDAISGQDGTTRLSVECGMVLVEGYQVQELQQLGSTVSLPTGLTNRMTLCVNREKVGEADLCILDNRFVLQVV